MQTLVKKNKLHLLASLLAGTVLPLAAQQAQPAPSPLATPPTPRSPASVSTDATAPVDNSTATTLDYLFNHKAGQGTTAKAGSDIAAALADKIKAVDVLKTPGLDDPIIRARFETYLGLEAVPDARIKEYFQKMQQVSDTLRTGDSFGAWKILYSMGDYTDIDAGISQELAHRVEAIWNTDRTASGLEQANGKLRSDIDTYDHNADMIAQDMKHQEQEDAQKGHSSSSQSSSSSSSSGSTNSPLMNVNADPDVAEAATMPTMGSSLQGKMELTAEYLNLLEARAKIKLNEIRENKMDDQGRSDFARYIKTLFVTHRYYHVTMGADFYRALFNEGEYPVDMADEVNISLETNNHVSEIVDVFKYKAGQGQIAAAAEQLQEGFVANEHHPALQGLPRDQKEKVGVFLSKLDVLKNQIESRDFEQVEAQIADIKKVATDFDATKPLALVNGVKLESRLRLGKAKLLAQAGALTQAMEEFQTAAEEWPGNPDLQTSASGFFNTEDIQNQSTTEFDRLVADKNYRAIFDKQLAFAPAVKGDVTREQQLKDALVKVQKAEMATAKANLLVMNGDADGAWETIEAAAKDWPDDMKLNRMLTDLTGRSADFVSAINHARDAEAKKEMGFSLTWYVNALSLYPGSTIALEGEDRVSKSILAQQNAHGSS